MGTIADLLNTDTQTKKEPLSFLNESPSVIEITKPKVKEKNYNISGLLKSDVNIKNEKASGLEYAGDVLKDIVVQPFGGVVDAAESLTNLALPNDKHIEISNLVPEPETVVGQFVRPGSQFLIPYTGAFKVLKGATLYVKNRNKLKTVLEGAKKEKTIPLNERISSRTGETFKFKPTTTVTRKQAGAIGIGAGAVTDAFAFAPYDPNLADLFVQFPATKFAVFEWLSTDPDGDPSMERLKNVLTGLVPSFVIPEVTRGVAKGFNYVSNPVSKSIKKYADDVIEDGQAQVRKILDDASANNKKVDVLEAEDLVQGRRTFKEKLAIKFKNQQFGKKLVINFLDKVRGIYYLEKAAKKEGIKSLKGLDKTSKELSAYQEARFLPAVGGMVEHFLLKQTFRFKDGVFESTGKDGLQDIITNNLSKTDNVDDFFNYVGAKSLQALKKSDSKTYKKILDTKEKRAKFDADAIAGDKKTSYQNALAELNRFNEDLLQIAVDSQLISAKTMASLIKKRKPYMPLYRDFSSDELLANKAGAGNKLRARLKGAPVGRKEGELPFANFFDNYIENVNGIITSAYKNHVKRNVFDIIDNAKAQGKGLDNWAKKLDKADKIKLKKIEVKSKELEKQLEKQNIELNINNVDDIDDLILFRSERIGTLNDKEEFVLRTNEKGETVQDVYRIISEPLYLTLSSISPKQYYGTNAFVGFARFWKNLLTRAVTYDPGFFAGANFVRDTISAAILSRNPFHLPFFSTAIRYRNKVMSNRPIKLKDGTTTTYKKLSQEFFLNGGSFASTLLKGDLQEGALKRIYRQMGHSDYNNVLNTPRKFLDSCS